MFAELVVDSTFSFSIGPRKAVSSMPLIHGQEPQKISDQFRKTFLIISKYNKLLRIISKYNKSLRTFNRHPLTQRDI